MKYIRFNVGGEPVGKGRPRFSTFNGFVRTHNDKKTESYESKVIFAYRQNHEDMIFDQHEQITAYIDAYFILPKKCYRYYKREDVTKITQEGQDMLSGKIRPTKKPDCDNIAKIILDALNGIAYHDDSQVVCIIVNKYYGETNRVEIGLESGSNEE